MHIFLAFLYNSCNFQYLILGSTTFLLSPSNMLTFQYQVTTNMKSQTKKWYIDGDNLYIDIRWLPKCIFFKSHVRPPSLLWSLYFCVMPALLQSPHALLKFTIFEILRYFFSYYHILHVHTIPTYRVYQYHIPLDSHYCNIYNQVYKL